MEITLVSLLILAFLSGGQSLVRVTEQTNTCHKSCPPGYYNIGMCSNPGTYKCKKCDKNTYTERENYVTKCLRCSNCELNEVAIKNCTSTQNVVCACKEGYYYSEYNPNLCEPCENVQPSNPNYTKSCQPPCQRKECLSNTKCRTTCQPSTTPFTTTTETASTIKNPNMTKVQHKWTYFLWLFLCIVVAIFMTLSGLWLLFLFVNQPGNSCSLPFCNEKKDIEPHAEDLELNEEHSQRCSAPATLTFHISEETPIISDCLSPPTLQQPVHISLIQQNAEHKAARQGEQSEHWPAIVLYTIIKEVPLRRWKEFLRLLSVADQELERVEMEAGFGLGSIERQYQMLRLWSQRSSASLNDVFSALHYMDLSGCAQLLQENLENLQWRPEPKQFPTV